MLSLYIKVDAAHILPQDVTLANAEGNVALHWACLNGHVEVSGGMPCPACAMRRLPQGSC
jgi:hypothetical protein